MAEAPVARPPRYFCHSCSQDINPDLPLFTCPRCKNGFIEEMTEEPEEEDPLAHLAELWHYNPYDPGHNEYDLSDDAEATEQSNTSEPVAGLPAHPMQHRNMFFPSRISIRRAGMRVPDRNQALHSIIEQLLTGLMGGAMPGHQGAGAFPAINLYGSPGDYAWGTGGLDNIITQLLNQLEGTGPPPAPKTTIDSLPSTQITQSQLDNKLQCSICMEDYSLGESVKELPCKHLYHQDCITPWLELHGTCPVCRKSLDGSEPVNVAPESSDSSSHPFTVSHSQGNRLPPDDNYD